MLSYGERLSRIQSVALYLNPRPRGSFYVTVNISHGNGDVKFRQDGDAEKLSGECFPCSMIRGRLWRDPGLRKIPGDPDLLLRRDQVWGYSGSSASMRLFTASRSALIISACSLSMLISSARLMS